MPRTRGPGYSNGSMSIEAARLDDGRDRSRKLPDESVQPLSLGQIAAFRASGVVLLSVTVRGTKPGH